MFLTLLSLPWIYFHEEQRDSKWAKHQTGLSWNTLELQKAAVGHWKKIGLFKKKKFRQRLCLHRRLFCLPIWNAVQFKGQPREITQIVQQRKNSFILNVFPACCFARLPSKWPAALFINHWNSIYWFIRILKHRNCILPARDRIWPAAWAGHRWKRNPRFQPTNPKASVL